MIRVNLLPHRAAKRKARQIQFAAFSGISLLLGLVIVGFVHVAISARIDHQGRRNQYLKDETAVLDKQISEIKKLREQTNALLARKNVVEDLQTTRSNVVHLLDQMLRILPDGVYLNSLGQSGDKINMVGTAQSQARISTLMRAIDASPWLELEPNTLVESHAEGNSYQFTLHFKLKKQAS